MRQWRTDSNNVFHTNFDLFTDLDEALCLETDVTKWSYCNSSPREADKYGAFMGCAPTKALHDMMHTGGSIVGQKMCTGLYAINQNSCLEAGKDTGFDKKVTFSVYQYDRTSGISLGVLEGWEKWGIAGTREDNIGFGFLVGMCIVSFILIVTTECVCGCCECLYKGLW